jgi:hypothetical protein
MKKGKYLGKVTKTSKTVEKSTVSDLDKVGSQRELLKKTGSAFTRIQ